MSQDKQKKSKSLYSSFRQEIILPDKLAKRALGINEFILLITGKPKKTKRPV